MSPLIRRCAGLFGLGLLAACTPEGQSARVQGADSAKNPVGKSRDAPAASLLVPATAGLDQVATVIRDPSRDSLPTNPREAEQVRLGYQIVRSTREHAAQFVGNDLSCTNCHLNGGQRDRGLPYVGVAATFPQYRGRDGRLITLEDRIADCFKRSMNGKAPPSDSREMMAVAAYITWLSRDQPMGRSPEWRGRNRIDPDKLIPIDSLDVARGGQLYTQQCAACHGPDGQGLNLGTARPGPLWGPRSWNDGAGAARVYTLAGFIRYAMPLTAPGSLSDEDAQHISAFINSHERPSYAGKARDYPGGDVPVDAVYYPRYPSNPLMR